ncbi:MAG: regulator of sigma E protease [Bacteroidia bacterium]|jgi:regulator of sigma E protease
MAGFIMAGQLILALAILVTFHELGHYLAARAFGIKVEKFYLFFDAWGVKLFSFKKGDTEYGIGWLPIGGYVKIAGMIDESVDTEQLKSDPEPWEFRSKPAWQRFIVMIGGIVMNLILGFLFYILVLKGYEKDFVTIDAVNQDGILVGELAHELGFEDGDKLISLNGHTYERFVDYVTYEAVFGGKMVVERDGEQKAITIPGNLFKQLSRSKGLFIDSKSEVYLKDNPKEGGGAFAADLKMGDRMVAINDTVVQSFTHFTKMLKANKGKNIAIEYERDGVKNQVSAPIDTAGILGFKPQIERYPDNRKKYTIGSAMSYSWKESWEAVYYNALGLVKMAQGDVPVKEVKSVIGMAKFFGGTWDWGWFWRMTAMISLALAFMNALPIPALDGGHMMFLTYEMIVGKPAPERVLLVAQYVGMGILLTLMALTMGNDIWQIIKSYF